MKLEINGITKAYGSNKALNGFCAQLTPGIYALLGPNGSGKSTLMHVLTHNMRADSGEVFFTNDSGCRQNTLDMGEKFREMIGFMPQYPGIYPNFTAKQFLQYVAALKGVGEHLPQRERDALINRQISEILEELELLDVSERKIQTFSGGMKQRLALAQAVLGAPKILILDEPTAGLDPKQRIAVRNYISRIAMDKIVIIATHVVSDVEFIAKEIILLKKGEIVNKAPSHTLLRELDGKVWELCIAQSEITRVQKDFAVTNISTSESDPDQAVLRILSDTRPSEDANPLPPMLEDYYLYVFGKKEH